MNKTDASEEADSSLQDSEDDFGEPENPFISDQAPIAKNRIDDIVFSRLTELKIEPANVCPDAVYPPAGLHGLFGNIADLARSQNVSRQ